METIQDLIGERYEKIIKKEFPDFTKTNSGGRLPDFDHRLFRVEAKAGFIDYGVRLKGYQIDSFKALSDKPVIYAVGYHLFSDSTDRLFGKTEETQRRILRRGMRIHSTYFVSREAIDSVWESERRISKERAVVYCMLKRRFLENIINDKPFSRDGEELDVLGFYGIDRNDFFLCSPRENRFNTGSFSYGMILHKKNDAVVIDYLSKANNK